MKISPNNRFLALGAHGFSSKIEIMKIENNEKLVDLNKDESSNLVSSIKSLDWSIDSKYIVFTSSDNNEYKTIDINKM